MKNAIDIKGVSKAYRDFTLDSLTLSLPEGSIMGLIGENGAGKSTTIKLIMNAILPDSGSIEVLGMDNKSPGFAEAKEDIGVVLDEAYFPVSLNCKNVNKIMGLTYKKWDPDKYFGYIKKFGLPEKKAFKDFYEDEAGHSRGTVPRPEAAGAGRGNGRAGPNSAG